ncbi:hypothetical protein BC938DRAFT_483579, partial [Jimgerdemannia flammicorona]
CLEPPSSLPLHSKCHLDNSAPRFFPDAAENNAGFGLAVTALATNYTLGYPFLVARHRHQAFPFLFRDRDESPLTYLRYLGNIRANHGLRALYPGLGIGLLTQVTTTGYEAVLNNVDQRLSPRLRKRGWPVKLVANIIFKGFELALCAPLYPLYRSALILQVQCTTALTQISIHTLHDLLASYKDGLLAIFFRRNLHWTSTLLPACILHFLGEVIVTTAYNYLHHQLVPTKPSKNQPAASIDLPSPPSPTSSTSPITLTPSSATSTSTSTSTALSSKPKQPQPQQQRDATAMLHNFYPDIVCGFASNLVSKLLVLPLETVVVKLALQDSGALRMEDHAVYAGFWDCVRRTYANEGGVIAFYNGLLGGWIGEVIVAWIVLEATWGLYRGAKWGIEWWYDEVY